MALEGFRKPPEEIDLDEAERSIRRANLLTMAVYGAAVAGAYWVLPRWMALPQTLAERLAFAARASVPVLFCIVVAVLMVSTGRRLSKADLGGSAAGPPSDRIVVQVAFLQNTLEQAVLAVGLYLALATLVAGRWLVLIPVGVLFFVVGRVLFYRGYRKGVEGRALGMTCTMLPTVVGYLVALGLLVAGWVGSGE